MSNKAEICTTALKNIGTAAQVLCTVPYEQANRALVTVL